MSRSSLTSDHEKLVMAKGEALKPRPDKDPLGIEGMQQLIEIEGVLQGPAARLEGYRGVE